MLYKNIKKKKFSHPNIGMINLLLDKLKLVAKNRNIKSYKNPGWSAGDMRQWPKKKKKNV